MNDQDINKCINRYFKEPTVDRDNLIRLFNFITEFANRNMQINMIRKLFQIAENNMARDNLKVIIKRYLHLVNQILEKDQKTLPQYKYQDYISVQIVPQFVSMLRNIFNYGPMELFPEMKLYRKRWAKRISENSYNLLQVEVLRQLKIDLDKGFSEQNVRKLAKSYQKRQFSQSEIEKYLPATNAQTTSQTRKSSAVSSSSQQIDDRTQKKIKRQSADGPKERVAQYGNQYISDMVSRHSSYITSNSNSYVSMSAVDPRRPFQIPSYRPPIPNIYPPNIYHLQNRVNNSAIGQNNAYIPIQPHGYYPNVQATPYNYPGNYNYNAYQNYAGMGFEPRQQIRYQNPNPKVSRVIQKMETIKKSWLFQCKFCGLFISTHQKYDQHMHHHFSEAQKQYQTSHSRTDHTRKGNKSLLPCLQEWIDSNRKKLTDQKFQIPIEGEIDRNEICMICKSQLSISWSDQIDCWVYQDAIRTKVKNYSQGSKSSSKTGSSPSICHAECYHTIDEFDKGSDSLAQ